MENLYHLTFKLREIQTIAKELPMATETVCIPVAPVARGIVLRIDGQQKCISIRIETDIKNGQLFQVSRYWKVIRFPVVVVPSNGSEEFGRLFPLLFSTD